MKKLDVVKDEKLSLYGGPWVSFLPVISFVAFAIYMSISMVEVSIQGMWVGILLGLFATFFLAKNKLLYSQSVLKGMSDNIAITAVACWIFAGIFAAILRDSGLVDGILWAAYHSGASGSAFLVVTFLASCLFATAAGTGFGTIAAGMGVLYPAGVLLGVDPLLMAGSILGGAAFGDNLAPISDTTICSASSQGADVGGVVRSRLKYSLIAGGLSMVILYVLGSMMESSAASIPYEQLAEHMNPMGLIMLAPALLTIVMAIRHGDVIYSLTIGIVLASIVAIVADLNTLENIIDPEHGLLIKGVAGWMADLSIMVLLLVGGIQIMVDAGGAERMLSATQKFIVGPRSAEVASGGASALLTSMMGINTPAILAVGTSLARPMGEKFKIHPYRMANIIDSLGCTFVYSLPWCGAVLFAAGLSEAASQSFVGVPVLSPLDITPWVVYSWILFAVMAFAILTGWGREVPSSSPTVLPLNESKA